MITRNFIEYIMLSLQRSMLSEVNKLMNMDSARDWPRVIRARQPT